MSDIEEDIRRAAPRAGERDEEFMKLRAHVRGTLLDAWKQLVPTGEWLIIDDRILDTVTNWMESKRR
jgi:hypothetical protein